MKNNNSILHIIMERAKSYYRINDYKCARDCYDQLLRINPNYTDALNNKGMSYNNL